MEVADLTEQELKSNLIKQLDNMNKGQLVAMHQAAAKLLADELMESFSKEWTEGKITREKIQAAIEEHRRRHPYKAPNS